MAESTTRILAKRMEAATLSCTPDETSPHSDEFWEAAAEAARLALVERIEAFTEALVRACIRQRHRGSRPETPGRAGVSCPGCMKKVRHYRECASIIDPRKD